MSSIDLPLHLFSMIISFCLNLNPSIDQSLQLRLVSRFFNEEALRLTFITRDAPLTIFVPRPRRALRHIIPYKLISRRSIQGTLSSTYVSPETQGWLRSVESAIAVLKSQYPSGLPSTVQQTTLPNCTSNPVFLDPMSILVCDAVGSYYPSGAIAARDWPQRCTNSDPGTNFWLFLAACSTGNRSLMRQALKKLDRNQRGYLRYLSGVTVYAGWQEAFCFLADEGYEANQLHGVTPTYIPKPPPVVSAVLSENVEFLQLILEYPCGLIKTGNTYEKAIGLALNLKDLSKGKIMVDLLVSNGHKLSPLEELRKMYK